MLPQQVEIAEHDKQMRIEKELRRRHAQLCDEPSRLLTQVGDAMHGFAAPLEEWGFVLPSGNVTKQQRQAHEREMLGRLDATWLGATFLKRETYGRAACRRRAQQPVPRLRARAVLCGRAQRGDGAQGDGDGGARRRSRRGEGGHAVPATVPAAAVHLHRPHAEHEAKDRSFGVGYASDPALMRHMAR